MSCEDILRKKFKEMKNSWLGSWKEIRSRWVDFFDQMGKCSASCEVKSVWQGLSTDYDLCSDEVLDYLSILLRSKEFVDERARTRWIYEEIISNKSEMSKKG